MSSCSNSSNINSVTTNVNLNTIGSRIIATIPKTSSDYTVEAGLAAGDVIRYDVSDPSNKIYTKSRANTVENAEVIGVIESVDENNLNVVIFGQINFPSDLFVNVAEDVLGASGGNDIYFLSPSITGGVQNLAPFEQTEIIKPILQVADDGVNNAIVLNYIGYTVGGEIATNDTSDSFVGQILEYFDEGQNLPPNFIGVSKEQSLVREDYLELYDIFGKKYGFTEKIILSSTTKVKNSAVGALVQQKTGNRINYTSRIASVNTAENSVTIEHGPNLNQINLSQSLFLGDSILTPVSTTVEKFVVPEIVNSNSKRITSVGSASGKISLAMVAKTVRGVSIPRKITVKELEVTDKLQTSTNEADTLSDINSEVNTLKTNVEDIQRKLGIIS